MPGKWHTIAAETKVGEDVTPPTDRITAVTTTSRGLTWEPLQPSATAGLSESRTKLMRSPKALLRVQHSAFAVPASAQQTTTGSQQTEALVADTDVGRMQYDLGEDMQETTPLKPRFDEAAQVAHRHGDAVDAAPGQPDGQSARRAALRARRMELVRRHFEAKTQAGGKHSKLREAATTKPEPLDEPGRPPTHEENAANGVAAGGTIGEVDQVSTLGQHAAQRRDDGAETPCWRHDQDGDHPSVFLTATGTTIELHSRVPTRTSATEDGDSAITAGSGKHENSNPACALKRGRPYTIVAAWPLTCNASTEQPRSLLQGQRSCVKCQVPHSNGACSLS